MEKNKIISVIEGKFWRFLHLVSPRLYEFAFKRQTVIKFIISGGTAAIVNLLLLYFFTDIVGLWYITSSVLSFIVAFVVSFCFQKFWTFQDGSTDKMHTQVAFYLVVTVTNLCINTFFIYLLVEFFAVHYLFAQIITGIIIACESFFVYRIFIFKDTNDH